MKNNNNSFSSAIKGLALALTVRTLATMISSNDIATKKLKKTAENTAENITSMFKIN